MSWRVAVLPFIERGDLFERYETSQSWDSAINRLLQSVQVEELRCPSKVHAIGEESSAAFLTSYVVPTGKGTIFGDPARPGMPIREITDGTSNTLMIVEAAGTRIIWTNPVDLDETQTPFGINLPGTEPGTLNGLFSSYHAGGAFAARADGSVSFLSEDTDSVTLERLMTPNADDEPDDEW